MLKSIRKHSKHPVAKIFLGLVLIAFAGLGLGSFVPSLHGQVSCSKKNTTRGHNILK